MRIKRIGKFLRKEANMGKNGDTKIRTDNQRERERGRESGLEKRQEIAAEDKGIYEIGERVARSF